MKRNITSLIFTAFISAVAFSGLKAQTISTVAGSMPIDGILSTTVGIYQPQCMAVDKFGNIFFTDYNNNRVRKVSTTGIITTIAGTGVGTLGDNGDGGLATAAKIYGPEGIIVDTAGNVYFSDNSMVIRKINTSGIISTIAGNGTSGFSGDGGPATAASLSYPEDLAIDKNGNIYFSDDNNARIRKINTSGIISTIAGNGTQGYGGDGGPATAAELNYAWGVAVDTIGNVYIGDSYNYRIRKVNTSGIITTIAGNGIAGFSGDGGIDTSAQIGSWCGVRAAKNGDIYISDMQNNRIRVINQLGIINTIVGNGTAGYSGDGGSAAAAEINAPYIAVTNDSGNMYILDGNNIRVRKVRHTDSVITTVVGNGSYGYSGDGVAATSSELGQPISVVVDDSGSIYIADMRNNRIRKVNNSGVISTIAGNGIGGYTGDGGLATAAEINAPFYIRLDHAGNIYFTDEGNNCIRKINTLGIISTITGNGTGAYSGDGGPATAAEVNQPNAVIVDNIGNIYIADASNARIRKIDTSGIIKTIAGNGTAGFSGDGGPATAAEFNNPYGLVLDNAGNLYVADQNNLRIRKIDASGVIHTIAGNGTAGFSGDGGPATAAELNYPSDIVMDAGGNLLIYDNYNYVIRKVSTTGIITTFAGNDSAGFYGDGGAATAAEIWCGGGAGIELDNSGNLYIADVNNNRIRRVTAPLSIQSITPSSDMFHIYPNPTTGDFTVSVNGSSNEETVSLMDITGKILESTVTVNNTTTFHTIGLPTGIYLVSVTIDGKSYTQKLVKTAN